MLKWLASRLKGYEPQTALPTSSPADLAMAQRQVRITEKAYKDAALLDEKVASITQDLRKQRETNHFAELLEASMRRRV